MRALGFLLIALVIPIALPHVEASDCYVTELNVNYSGSMTVGSDFVVAVQFKAICLNYHPASYRVIVIDGDNGRLLSAVNTTQSSTQVHVTARNATGSWYLEVQVSALGASTWGTVGRGFPVYISPTVPVLRPPGNYTEPPCRGKECR